MQNLFDKWKILTVGQLAQRSGVAISTLHFYETKGLITSSRNNGNQRQYNRDILRSRRGEIIGLKPGHHIKGWQEALSDPIGRHWR